MIWKTGEHFRLTDKKCRPDADLVLPMLTIKKINIQ
jgi:hypothetical protein